VARFGFCPFGVYRLPWQTLVEKWVTLLGGCARRVKPLATVSLAGILIKRASSTPTETKDSRTPIITVDALAQQSAQLTNHIPRLTEGPQPLASEFGE
jgi:hypothetical protein